MIGGAGGYNNREKNRDKMKLFAETPNRIIIRYVIGTALFLVIHGILMPFGARTINHDGAYPIMQIILYFELPIGAFLLFQIVSLFRFWRVQINKSKSEIWQIATLYFGVTISLLAMMLTASPMSCGGHLICSDDISSHGNFIIKLLTIILFVFQVISFIWFKYLKTNGVKKLIFTRIFFLICSSLIIIQILATIYILNPILYAII